MLVFSCRSISPEMPFDSIAALFACVAVRDDRRSRDPAQRFTSSTRRFFARPRLEALSATGLSGPYPVEARRPAAIPALTRAAPPAAARQIGSAACREKVCYDV